MTEQQVAELSSRLQSATHCHFFIWTGDGKAALHHDSGGYYPIQTFDTYKETSAFVDGVWFGKDRA